MKAIIGRLPESVKWVIEIVLRVCAMLAITLAIGLALSPFPQWSSTLNVVALLLFLGVLAAAASDRPLPWRRKREQQRKQQLEQLDAELDAARAEAKKVYAELERALRIGEECLAQTRESLALTQRSMAHYQEQGRLVRELVLKFQEATGQTLEEYDLVDGDSEPILEAQRRLELLVEVHRQKLDSLKRGGRPRGRLSSRFLDDGTTVDDIVPFLQKAKRALEARDGSFLRLCDDRGFPESTVRDWLKRYSDRLN